MLSLADIEKGARVLVCVSGGADSVCLLRALLEREYSCVVAHCNFHLRAEESDADERFVRQMAEQLNVQIVTTSFDTLSYAKTNHLSIEMAARELRYAWFEEQRKALSCDYIAVAHNLNDEVETFFLNLTRGTGLKGLTGMRQTNGHVIRPLLSTTRDEITEYLNSIGQTYRTDSTNSDTTYRRNRIRHNILPEFTSMNPSFLRTMSDTMENLRAAEACLTSESQNSEARLQQLYMMLQPYGFNHDTIRQIWAAEQRGASGKRFANSNVTVIVNRGEARVYETETAESEEELPTFKVDIVQRPDSLKSKATTAFFDYDKIREPLTLRKWREGDWFIPFGMKGRKKLSDFMTEQKLDLCEKEHQMVLSDADDRILWVVGRRTDDRFAVTNQTLQTAKITIEEK